ncbi:MAG: DUF1592 domain-containing protein [Verrucomicrobiota bacterium]
MQSCHPQFVIRAVTLFSRFRGYPPVAIASFISVALILAADGKEIYQEDFDEGNSILSNWRMKEPTMWKVIDGILTSQNTSPNPGIGCSTPRFKRTHHVKMSLDFNLHDGKGLEFKINHFQGGHLCRVVIDQHGFLVRINRNKAIPIPEAINLDHLPLRIEPGTWHTLEVELSGDALTSRIVGLGEKTYQSSYFAHDIGTIGLAARGTSIQFDNLKVESLPNREASSAVQSIPSAPIPRTTSARVMQISSPTVAESPASVETASHELTPPPIPDWNLDIDTFLDRHCYDCHDDIAMKGNLDLLSLSTDLSHTETRRRWVRVFDYVESGEMPPENKKDPSEEEKAEFASILGPALVAGHHKDREVVLRRLNRSEYENTVNDLFGIDISIKEDFPTDPKKHGFDNNGEGLTLSAELIELYLKSAHAVLDRALGTDSPPETFHYDGHLQPLVAELMYTRWEKLIGDDRGTIVFGSEFGAGSQLARLNLPSPGHYRFRIHAKAYQSELPVMMQLQTGVVKRAGTKRFQGFHSIPPEGRVVEIVDYMVPGESLFPRPFGTIGNISGWLNRYDDLSIQDYPDPGLLITRIEIDGPIDEWPPPSRKILLGDIPLETGSATDAEQIFRTFLPRAFRRPVTELEISRFKNKVVALMDQGRSFEDSLRWALAAALCSPDFLFLKEPPLETTDRINNYALANRLSYFLWSTMPDERLTELATEGRLSDPEVLREETERLLNHSKARAFTENFAHQWLHLRDIDATSPDTKLFPEFDDFLKESMVKESEYFFEEVLQNNLSIRSFIDSDWLIINARLAEHYDVRPSSEEGFQRVSLPEDSPRGGVMTMASVLKVTANGANTSPVERGVWMLENVMGIHPPPPPPAVPAVVPDVTGANTLRELLAVHSGSESCRSCHELIDPPGFALESFDPVGAWRTEYQFQGSRSVLPVDASGITRDGQPFEDIHDYKNIILGQIDQVTYGLTEKVLSYAIGRGMGFADREEMKRIVAKLSKNDYRFRDLIHATVQSPIFHQP